MTIRTDVGGVATGPVTFTFAFSEAVNVDAASVLVEGLAPGPFTVVDETTATLVVTPGADAAGEVTVSLPAGSFSDVGGTPSEVAASATRAFDTRTRTILARFAGDDPTAPVGFLGYEPTGFAPDPDDPDHQVIRAVRDAAAETFAGIYTTACPAGVQRPIPLAEGATVVTARVRSPAAGIPYLLKVESGDDPDLFAEVSATSTVADTWETLSFDLAEDFSLAVELDYEAVSLFPNFGAVGAEVGEQIFYVDEIALVGVDAPPSCPVRQAETDLPLTFDEAAFEYALGPVGGAESSLVADPEDASNQVVRVDRGAGAEEMAGVVVSTRPEQGVGDLPLAYLTRHLALRVRVPEENVRVRVRYERAGDASRLGFVEVRTTRVDEWETLDFDIVRDGTTSFEFDFERGGLVGDPPNRLTVLFGTDDAANQGTYYFDDLRML